MHQATELKEKCIDFIANNAREVVTTDAWDRVSTARPELAVQLFKYMALFKN